jgi:hypothetical protein
MQNMNLRLRTYQLPGPAATSARVSIMESMIGHAVIEIDVVADAVVMRPLDGMAIGAARRPTRFVQLLNEVVEVLDDHGIVRRYVRIVDADPARGVPDATRIGQRELI